MSKAIINEFAKLLQGKEFEYDRKLSEAYDNCERDTYKAYIRGQWFAIRELMEELNIPVLLKHEERKENND